jgi:hypothetical protein
MRRATTVHPIVDLQIEYSLVERRHQGKLLDTCRSLGIAVTAYGVLARGLLDGHLKPNLPADDYRNVSARLQGDNLRRNLGLAERLRALAAALHATPAQAPVACVAAEGPDIVPLIGARNRSWLAEALGCIDLGLTARALGDHKGSRGGGRGISGAAATCWSGSIAPHRPSSWNLSMDGLELFAMRGGELAGLNALVTDASARVCVERSPPEPPPASGADHPAESASESSRRSTSSRATRFPSGRRPLSRAK